MSYNPRIEELSDSDPDAVASAASDSDPDEMDIAELNIPQTATILPRAASPSAVTVPQPQAASPARAATEAAARERTKHHQCLYPVYFDAGRSRAEGRRVSRGLAVPNPLARDLADACASLSLNVVFEPAKCHPKDWANPGRVRVLVKSQGASVVADRGVDNKHHLYLKVAAYLQAHPTNAHSPLKLRIPGLPVPEGGAAPPPPATPRGWKMGTVLPLHSPAVSGGGVSDNMFGEMLKGMGGAGALGGAGGEGMGGMGGMAEMMRGMLGGAGAASAGGGAGTVAGTKGRRKK